MVLDFKLTAKETTILDDSLKLKQTYKYQFLVIENERIIIHSGDMNVMIGKIIRYTFYLNTFLRKNIS